MSDLLRETAALVEIASVSRDEARLADHIEKVLRGLPLLEVVRIEDNLIASTHLGRASRVLLAGHLDTVVPNENAGARIEGDRLFGLGSADMKGGLAVMVDLAVRLADPIHDVTFVFYACEEIARVHSGLHAILRADPNLLEADVAILLEPTNALVEAGCQGVMRVKVTLGGKRAHSARPWTGINAIHRLGALLAHVEGFSERTPTIDGCTYHETLQAVAIEGGVAGNVLPDRASVTLSHRFAPDRTVEEAFAELVSLFEPVLHREFGDLIECIDAAPAARPSLKHELLAGLVARSGMPPVAKIAWTDVAFFFERGIPAANFGPGDPTVAHTAGEFVDRGDLDRTDQTLSALLGISRS